MDNSLTTVNIAFNNAKVHLSHHIILITLNHLRIIYTSMRPSNNHNVLYRVIFHHLLLSARYPLIPRDRFLPLTMDSTTHILTFRGTEAPPTSQHYLYLFLNPYKRSPYLQYTYQSDFHNNRTVSAQRLTITISLPSSTISFKRSKHQHMIRTTSHTPDLGETITFSAESVEYQMTIPTLVTHMLLSIPVLKTPSLLWTIVRHTNAQQHTPHLVLATFALKRYHSIWFTLTATPIPAPRTDLELSCSDPTSLVYKPPTTSIPQSPLSPIPPLTIFQLLISLILNHRTSKRRPYNAPNHSHIPSNPQPTKRYKTRLLWTTHTTHAGSIYHWCDQYLAIFIY